MSVIYSWKDQETVSGADHLHTWSRPSPSRQAVSRPTEYLRQRKPHDTELATVTDEVESEDSATINILIRITT